MTTLLETQSTLTARYQTTVPEAVRRALGLGKRDKIRYAICSDGAVIMTRADDHEGSDPLLERFLHFLADDIASHPDTLQAVSPAFSHYLQTLTGETEIDLDAPLPEEDE